MVAEIEVRLLLLFFLHGGQHHYVHPSPELDLLYSICGSLVFLILILNISIIVSLFYSLRRRRHRRIDLLEDEIIKEQVVSIFHVFYGTIIVIGTFTFISGLIVVNASENPISFVCGLVEALFGIVTIILSVKLYKIDIKKAVSIIP